MGIAKIADVQSRTPYREITAESSPSIEDVRVWLAEAETLLNATLQAAGVTPPAEASVYAPIIRSWICDLVEGRLREAWSSSGGEDSVVAAAAVDRFTQRLEDITNRPAKYYQLFGNNAEQADSVRLRSERSGTSPVTYDPQYKADTDL
ncbi:MAG: hypothetical protein CMF70_07015 [Magnetovibrio sp.]|nr:hypothetical protein [Magnetovibrio sp.]|tara:strand:- start:443 stop:889 length:447 start_codon:yes stop_codon:yes gene_type:complete